MILEEFYTCEELTKGNQLYIGRELSLLIV